MAARASGTGRRGTTSEPGRISPRRNRAQVGAGVDEQLSTRPAEERGRTAYPAPCPLGWAVSIIKVSRLPRVRSRHLTTLQSRPPIVVRCGSGPRRFRRPAEEQTFSHLPSSCIVSPDDKCQARPITYCLLWPGTNRDSPPVSTASVLLLRPARPGPLTIHGERVRARSCRDLLLSSDQVRPGQSRQSAGSGRARLADTSLFWVPTSSRNGGRSL